MSTSYNLAEYLVEGLEQRTFLSAGAIDPTFGTAGKLFGAAAGGSGGMDAAIQADGKIVVASEVRTGANNNVQLARYLANGKPDTKFGKSGKTLLDITSYDAPERLCIQSDGKLVALIYTSKGPYRLVRWLPTGAIDKTFGTGGKVSLPPSGFYSDIAIQPDGKMLVAGSDTILRYTATGGVDSTFGTGGTVSGVSGVSQVRYRSSDNKIIAAGDEGESLSLWQFTSAGAADAAFGAGGHVAVSLDRLIVQDLLLASQGKILVSLDLYTSGTRNHICRFNTDGTLDTTWGVAGKTSLGSAIGARKMALTKEGGVAFISGSYMSKGQHDVLVGRLTAAGTWLTSFGNKGTVITNFGGEEYGGVVLVQKDGRILAFGQKWTSIGATEVHAPIMARYLVR